ncbi:MAG: hypothetical protein JJT75_00460 [Opitutales bacterium]|nr:hypothetical protein [Opitutales bacterium]MCH8539285.1 hypothetical protein [Opitutales bacterium]
MSENHKNNSANGGNEMTPMAWAVLVILLIGTVVAGIFDEETGFPLFYSVFGFAGCLLLLFLTKVVGKKALSRKEDYYEPYALKEEPLEKKGGHH